MNEREREEYELGKADILVGKLIYQLTLFVAVAAPVAVGSSISFAILDIFPKWVDIVIGVGGALNIPSSIMNVRKLGYWLDNAEKVMDDYERSHFINN